MSDLLLETLKKNHSKNRLFWGIVLVDILVFAILVLIFDYLDFPGKPLIDNLKIVNDVSLMVIVILLVIIIFLKRSYLVPEKLIKKAGVRGTPELSAEMVVLKEKHGAKIDQLFNIEGLLRRYYFIIWSIANIVVLIGFMVFLISNQFRPFLIYGVVGVYTLVINFPFFSIVERCYHRVFEES